METDEQILLLDIVNEYTRYVMDKNFKNQKVSLEGFTTWLTYELSAEKLQEEDTEKAPATDL